MWNDEWNDEYLDMLSSIDGFVTTVYHLSLAEDEDDPELRDNYTRIMAYVESMILAANKEI